ncbi:hypothetical protein OSH11_11745 [Kaistia dalseonensis]|uniref:Uncharacterized protein n=1 Tax=Kaistia dalseonensis TaxID=410840 RepID=A0ABU0H6Q5_9HYPH|nr:hypothetical protein [Kaistia dalseonensis]MCX5495383.1 hypothetical protein [Kaistia dalseonensis]MDQ0437970.1 hypothetical protein [Kaistia dalseonensis]
MIVAILVLILFAILFPGFLRGVFVVLALIVLFAVGSTHHAAASELPIVDVDRACSWRFDDNRYAYNRCISIEQATYNMLVGLWPNLSGEIRAQASGMIGRLMDEHNPYVYQNTYDLVLMLIDQQAIKDQLTAPKRQFQP